MRRADVCVGVGVALSFLAIVATAQAKEERVALAKVPKAVMKTIEARFAGAHVSGAARETEADGTVVYEVMIRHNGAKKDVIVTPGGSLLVIEKEIAAKDLPPAVARTLTAAYPGATYRSVEELFQVEKKGEKLAYYEVTLVPVGKKAREVKVTPVGGILEIEEQ